MRKDTRTFVVLQPYRPQSLSSSGLPPADCTIARLDSPDSCDTTSLPPPPRNRFQWGLRNSHGKGLEELLQSPVVGGGAERIIANLIARVEMNPSTYRSAAAVLYHF